MIKLCESCYDAELVVIDSYLVGNIYLVRFLKGFYFLRVTGGSSNKSVIMYSFNFLVMQLKISIKIVGDLCGLKTYALLIVEVLSDFN
jgi:hypothetical protein